MQFSAKCGFFLIGWIILCLYVCSVTCYPSWSVDVRISTNTKLHLTNWQYSDIWCYRTDENSSSGIMLTDVNPKKAWTHHQTDLKCKCCSAWSDQRLLSAKRCAAAVRLFSPYSTASGELRGNKRALELRAGTRGTGAALAHCGSAALPAPHLPRHGPPSEPRAALPEPRAAQHLPGRAEWSRAGRSSPGAAGAVLRAGRASLNAPRRRQGRGRGERCKQGGGPGLAPCQRVTWSLIWAGGGRRGAAVRWQAAAAAEAVAAALHAEGPSRLPSPPPARRAPLPAVRHWQMMCVVLAAMKGRRVRGRARPGRAKQRGRPESRRSVASALPAPGPPLGSGPARCWAGAALAVRGPSGGRLSGELGGTGGSAPGQCRRQRRGAAAL